MNIIFSPLNPVVFMLAMLFATTFICRLNVLCRDKAMSDVFSISPLSHVTSPHDPELRYAWRMPN